MDDPTKVVIGGLAAAATTVATTAAKHAVDRLIGPTIDGWVVDLKTWRETRRGHALEATALRADAMLREADRESVPIDMKRLAGIVDGASLEEDPYLRERWAALLANAASPTDTAKVHPAFSQILGALAGFDARVLEVVATGTTPVGEQPRGTERQRISLYVGEPNRVQVDVALDNLRRLGLIAVGQHAKWDGIPGIDGPDDMIMITALGSQFLDACQPPQASEASGDDNNS